MTGIMRQRGIRPQTDSRQTDEHIHIQSVCLSVSQSVSQSVSYQKGYYDLDQKQTLHFMTLSGTSIRNRTRQLKKVHTNFIQATGAA